MRQLWWRKARGGDNEGRHGPTEQTAAQDKFGVWNWVERHCEKRVPTQRGKPHAAPHDQCTWLRRNQGPNLCRECQTLCATSPTWMRTPRRSGRIHLQDEHGDAPTRRRQCRELNGKLHAVRSQPINTCTKDRQNSVRPARATAQRCAPHNPTRRSGKRNAATLLAQHATHHPLASVSFCAPKRHASVLYSTATD